MTTAARQQAPKTPQANTNENAPSPETDVNSQTPVEERIRMRAYELYEQRGGVEGDAESDWYQAETEIVTESSGHDH